jgi:uncharacterized membrane protein
MAPAATAAPEDEEIPQLQLLVEDRNYSVGDRVDVTILVTANGRPVNPDIIPIWPGPNPLQGPIMLAIIYNFTFGEGGAPGGWFLFEPANITHVDKGHYEANFTVQEEYITAMLPMGGGLPFMGKVVFMMARCQYTPVGSPDPIGAGAMALAMVEDGPIINVEVSDFTPSPGDTVDVTVRTINGTPVDAAQVKVEIMSYDGEMEQNLGTLSVNRESLGVYKASYTVPVDLDRATMYTVHAGASFADYNDSVFISPLFGMGFMVNFFDVYLQNVSATADETDLAVWVADPEGVAQEDIDVEVTITVYDDLGMTQESYSNVTDVNGQSRFLVSHQNAERVDIQGNVTDGVHFQSFFMEAMVDRSVPEPNVPDEIENFAVEPWDMPEGNLFDQVKYPGDSHTMKYRAYNTSGPLPDKRINWYLIDRAGFFDTNYTVLEEGYEVTDENGDLEITFTVPDNDVNGWLMFEANVWNPDEEGWERSESSEPLIDAGFFSVDESIEITVDRVEKGDPVEIRVNTELPDNSFMGHFFAVIDEDTGNTMWGQPFNLGPMGDDFNVIPLPKVGPDIYGIDKTLPDFFPEDQSVALMVMTVDLTQFRIRTNYAILEYGESSTKGVDATIPDPPEPIRIGDTGTFEVVVENTGAGTETYTIAQSSGPPGGLEFDVDNVTIEPSASEAIMVTIDVPTDIDEDTYYFNITVTSSRDPTVNKTIEVSIDVLVNGVDLWSNEPEMSAFREEAINFVVTLNNTGQGEDTYDITLEGTGAAWATPGQSSLLIPENRESEVVIQVDVPDDADEGVYMINVTTTSSDGITAEVVTLLLEVMVDGVTVVAADELAEVWPDQTVILFFNITNTGQGPDTFDLTLEGDEPGWGSISVSPITIEEGATETVTVDVMPPSDPAEGFYEYTLRATSANGITTTTATTSVKIWVSGVELTTNVSKMDGHRGDLIQFTLNVGNTGDGDDAISLSTELDDWADLATFPSNTVTVASGESEEVTLTIHVPDDIDEGTYVLNAVGLSEDGKFKATISLRVDITVNSVDITMSDVSKKVQQGKKVEFTLTVTNTGQGEDTFNVLVSGAAQDWAEVEKTVLTLAEDGVETITITVKVPKKAKAGDAMLNITVVSSDDTIFEESQFQIIVKKADEQPGMGVVAALAATVLMALVITASRRRLA